MEDLEVTDFGISIIKTMLYFKTILKAALAVA
jgi:hypothetical protein